MCIIYQKTEIVFFLECTYLIQLSKIPCHSENALGYHKDATAALFGQFRCPLKLFFTVLYVIVWKYESLAHMKPQSIHNTGMGFGIVHYNIVPVDQGIDYRYHPLVAIVE